MTVPTLIHIDGFEYGISPFVAAHSAGGALGTTVSSTGITCDSSVKRSGAYSLKITSDGATVIRLLRALTSTDTLVGSFYFYATAVPTADTVFFIGNAATPQFRLNTTGTVSALFTSGTAVTTAGTYTDSTWHRIDFKFVGSANPLTLDWQIDGSAQTQAVRTIAAVNLTGFNLGSSGSAANGVVWLDDLVLSATAADYPIGVHTVLAVVPTSDGTHNSGTNTIEDNAGTDIASPNAFPILATFPPQPNVVYIRQSTISTTAYAEVNFANHDATMTTLWDAQAYVFYQSSTNAVNEGATVVSYDGFTTPLEVYGTASARTNYQTSATTTSASKVANASSSQGVITRPAGTWDTTSFDALQARVGYSNDVTGNPRWLGLMVQYAGTVTTATGDTQYAGMVPI